MILGIVAYFYTREIENKFMIFVTVLFQGGFRLQILDALDRPLVDLTPVTKQSEFVESDPT